MLLMKVVALLAENVVGQNVTKFSRIKPLVNKKVQTNWTFLFTVFKGFFILLKFLFPYRLGVY